MERQRRMQPLGLVAAALLGVSACGAVESAPVPDRPAADSAPAASSAPAGAGGGQAGEASSLPGLPSAAQAAASLQELAVAEQGSMAGYSREKFPHWASHGENCDTREVILERDGTGIERDDECRAVSGNWKSVYDGKTFTDAGDLDIDHTVPLANAWRSGADEWSQDERKAFANDLTHPQLLAVSAGSNRSKGDQGPEEWQPPLESYWCVYGRSWTSVKATYELTVTEDEKNWLTKMLDTCA